MTSTPALPGLIITFLALGGGYALSSERGRTLRALLGLMLTSIALLSLALGSDLISGFVLSGASHYFDTGNIAVRGTIFVGVVIVAVNLLDGVARPTLRISRVEPAAEAASTANRLLLRLGMIGIAIYAVNNGLMQLPG